MWSTPSVGNPVGYHRSWLAPCSTPRGRRLRAQSAPALIALALGMAALWPAAPGAQSPLPPEPYRELAREVFEELIEINTTHSAGDNTAAARAMANRLLAAGFPAADVHVIEPAPRKGNLVARLRGSAGGRSPILLLAHIDVVEANPEDWNLDPFTFVEQEGYFYGRGTADDKDEAAIHIVNLIRLRDEGVPLVRDVIVALTADEEGGPHNGVQYLLTHHRDLIDAEFALNEGGGGALQGGRRISNAVQASEKVYQSFQLEVTNPGGHSSLPRQDNAIYELAAALVRIGAYRFPVVLNEVTRAFFERTADLVDVPTGQAMRRMLSTPSDPDSVELLSRVPAYNSRLRTTCVATMLDAGHAQNALPQRAQAIVNCRLLPGQDVSEVRAALEAAAAEPGLMVTPLGQATPSPPSPLAPGVLAPIERVTAEMWPGVPVVPTMSTGATDGLYLRNAGIPVYGVSGVFSDIDDVRSHGRDERILVRSFYEAQEFLYRLVRELTAPR